MLKILRNLHLMVNRIVKKTLIFKTSLAGHRLEYVHHIYEEACKRTDEEFVFALPDSFSSLKHNFVWEECDNIRIIILDDKELQPIHNAKGRLGRAKRSVELLRKYVKIEQPSHVLLIMIMSYMPYLALMKWHDVKISGIIYSIYLYETSGFVRQLFNRFFYTLFAKRKCFGKLFILNDEQSARKLNSLYKTEKFTYLPDPIPTINKEEVKNVRIDMGICPNDRMFLQFGGLTKRKGTLLILDAISFMKEEDLKDKVFVFAGIVGKDIKEQFYTKVKMLKKRVRIIIYDEFCSFSLINNLCKSCDVILMPYSNTNQSSGVLGYASFFQKPVIGPQNGLVGNLIKINRMGVTLRKMNAKSLSEELLNNHIYSLNDYYINHCVSDFSSIVLS